MIGWKYFCIFRMGFLLVHLSCSSMLKIKVQASRHCTARFSAFATGLHAFIHPTNTFAIPGALFTNLRANIAGQAM